MFQGIKPGESRAQVIAEAGVPDSSVGNVLTYDFTKLPGFSGVSGGAQAFSGVTVILNSAGVVQNVQFEWVDTTGSAPSV